MTPRNRELAQIHIAKKDLHLDDETYRQIIQEVGRVESGSSSDLDGHGRQRVLAHFKSKGWKPRAPKKAHSRRDKALGNASDEQVRLIRHIWLCLAEAGVVRQRDEQALRTWIRASTRRYHPQHAGYSAPEFLPATDAQKVIEQLKGWAGRCNVEWQ